MVAIPMKVSTPNVGIPMRVADKPIVPAEIGAAIQIIEGEPYTGIYVFTPSSQQQTVATRDKVLFDDIVINAMTIPYTETDNAAGGKTLTIG